MYHRLSMKRCTMMSLIGHAKRHDSNQQVSGIPGAIQSHPGCHVWDTYLKTDQTVTWSSGCADGLAQGEGTLTWRDGDGEITTSSGQLQRGKRHGRWVLRFASGTVEEGPYVDGKRHGRWVERTASGGVIETPYVDGKEHGREVWRNADGKVVAEINYVNGVEQ